MSLQLERKMFQNELSRQETMSERVIVRKDLQKCERKIKELTEQLQKRNTRMETTTTALKDFQKEVEKMDENDIRLKTIKEWKKSMEKKDRDGIRNYPESCIEKMLEDDQVHGI